MTAAVSTLLTFQTSAHAATTWSAGTQVETLRFGDNYPVVGALSAPRAGGYAVTGMAKMSGDYLYVRDECKDSKSAVVQWRRYGDPALRWNCRNRHGYMPWS